MSCAICLEDYLENSVVNGERVPYQLLSKVNRLDDEELQGCWFGPFGCRSRSRRQENHQDQDQGHESDGSESSSSSTTSRTEIRSGTFDQIVATRCGHAYHLKCILTWCERSKECPTCRKKINVKKLTKLHLEGSSVMQRNTTAGVLVTMSLNQYSSLADAARRAEASYDKIESMKKDHDAKIKEMEQDHQKNRLGIISAKNATIEKNKGRHDAKIKQLESAHKEEVKALQTKLLEMERRLKSTQVNQPGTKADADNQSELEVEMNWRHLTAAMTKCLNSQGPTHSACERVLDNLHKYETAFLGDAVSIQKSDSSQASDATSSVSKPSLEKVEGK